MIYGLSVMEGTPVTITIVNSVGARGWCAHVGHGHSVTGGSQGCVIVVGAFSCSGVC